jgi:signal transduction histidine kinase
MDPAGAYLFSGLLYIALPVTAWSILRGRHDGRAVELWCLGGLLAGAGLVLIGLRPQLPAWVSMQLANVLALASVSMRLLALQRERGLPERRGQALLAWLLPSLAYLIAAEATPVAGPRTVVASLGLGLGSGAVAWAAWRLHRLKASRSAAMIAAAYGFVALTLLVRALAFALHWRSAQVLMPGIETAATFVGMLVGALYGNLGYIGLALEAARASELEQAATLAREQERVAQIERFAHEQAALLTERSELLARREDMLATLAHEVRQPLNNASAALQSATKVVAAGPDGANTAQRLQRASQVLSQITASVDNTLPDAVLLDERRPLDRQDSDVPTLLKLVVAELPPVERARIQVDQADSARTASMQPGLMRLALRNLLANALAHSATSQPVHLRVRDSDEPLALVFEVEDSGSGIDADLQPGLFTDGPLARVSRRPGGHGLGLGLSIVRRVMRLHGGWAQLLHSGPGGTCIRLVLPQDLPGLTPDEASA